MQAWLAVPARSGAAIAQYVGTEVSSGQARPLPMAFKLAAVATRTATARSGFPPLIRDRERCEPFRLGLPTVRGRGYILRELSEGQARISGR
jgi:hypothetical protein